MRTSLIRLGRGALAVVLTASVLVAVPATAGATHAGGHVAVNSFDDSIPGDCSATSTTCNLRAAVAAVQGQPNALVTVPPGTHLLDGEIDITGAVTIIGAGEPSAPLASVIDAGGSSRVFDISATGVTIGGVTITGGNVNQTGGGILVRSGADLTLMDSMVTGNTAREGGGIDVEGSVTIRRSTFSGNSANRKGGGLRVDGTAEIVNSTFTQNVAQSGGAVSVAGSAEISYSTFVDNTSNTSSGGGVDSNGGIVIVTGSILTQSNQSGSTGSDCSGNPDLLGPNYVGNAQGCQTGPGVLVGTIVGSADVQPLADNGGPTLTIAVRESSPVVDAGGTSCDPVTGASLTDDQRGLARPVAVGAGLVLCDLGAYELNPLSIDLAFSADATEVGPGASKIDADEIPGAIIATDALFDSSLEASPLDAFPLNSAPLDAFPLDAFPLDAFPLDAFPLDAFFAAALPLDAFVIAGLPLDAFPLDAFPLDAFPLSDLVLVDELLLQDGWVTLLEGTDFADIPIHSLTLGDVRGVPTIANLPLDAFDLGNTPLDAFPLTALLLAGLPLDAFPLDESDASPDDRIASWCEVLGDFCATFGITDAETANGVTLASVALAGVDIGSVDLAAAPLDAFAIVGAPLDAFPLASSPLDAFPLDAFNWSASPLGGFSLASFPLDAFSNSDPNPGDDVVPIIDCGVFDCSAAATSTLADVDDVGALLGGLAELAALRTVWTAEPDLFVEFSIADIIAGIILPSVVPWQEIDLSVAGLQNAATEPEDPFHYIADVTVSEDVDSLEVAITLPEGFAYATVADDPTLDGAVTGDPVLSLDPVSEHVVMTFSFGSLSAGAHQLVAPVFAGLRLGDFTASASATATAGAQTASAGPLDAAAVSVVDLGDGPTAPGSQVVQDGFINLAHVSSGGDVDIYSFEVTPTEAALGLQADILLSNLPADYDLSHFVEVSTPLRGDPVYELGYVDAIDYDLNPSDDIAAPDVVQDIPRRLPIPNTEDFVARAISANRGTADELIETGTLRAGTHYVQVSAYNGASSDEPYALRFKTTSSESRGDCPTDPFGDPSGIAHGSLPDIGTLPADLNTIFLVNTQMLRATYGGAVTGQVLAALPGADAWRGFGVVSAIVPVDGSPAVRTAYSNRSADRCDPQLSNDVVREIGDVITDITDARPGVEYVVIVGDDRQIPMANIEDNARFANERTFAPNFSGNNESIAALVGGFYRTDDVYGTDAGLRVRDHELFSPTRAVGRLVETPQQIIDALEKFAMFGGQLDPTTGTKNAFVTGYDFMTDGAEANVDAFTAGGYAVTPLINDSWDAGSLATALQTAYDIVGINAHFDERRALPADEGVLFEVGDLPDITRTIVYSIGCHAGYSRSDVQVGAPAVDWAETFADRDSLFMGNTGYGYGDTEVVALAELLTTYLVEEATEPGAIGLAWVDAKQRMLRDAALLDAYQEKTMMQFVFYGLPMFHVGQAPPDLSVPATAAVTAAANGAATSTDPITGLSVTTVNSTLTQGAGLELVETDDGDYYTAEGSTLKVAGLPIQPMHFIDVTQSDSDGGLALLARDALITGLESIDLPTDESLFDPVFFRPVADTGANEPRAEYADGSFPSDLVGVSVPYTDDGVFHQDLSLVRGQFRASSTPGEGTQRLHTTIEATVFYAPPGSSDITPPLIRESAGFVNNDVVFFEVDVDDSAVRTVVMFRDLDGGGRWQFVELTEGLDSTWRGGWPFVDSTNAEFFVQALDAAGNVAMSDAKALNFLTTPPIVAGDIQLTASGPLDVPSGWYTGPVSVTAMSSGDVHYSIDGEGFVEYSGPFTVTADGAHLITAVDDPANPTQFTVLYVAIDQTAPQLSHDPTGSGYTQGPVTVTVTAVDGSDLVQGSGVVSIVTDAGDLITFDPSVSTGELSFEVTAEGVTTRTYEATDGAGNTSTGTVEVSIDNTAPLVTCDVPPTGWSNTAVEIACTATDAGAGLAVPADASFVLVADIDDNTADANVSVDVPVIGDAVGNLSAAGVSVSGIKIDKIAPSATIVSPADGTRFAATDSPNLDVLCADADSGIASCDAQIDGNAVSDGAPLDMTIGMHEITLVATDNAGNVSQPTTSTYFVDYGVCLLYDPTQAKNIGSTYPIKLRLCDAAGNNLSSNSIVLKAVSINSGTDPLGPNSSAKANKQFEFRYQANTQSYIYNLDTGATGLGAGTHTLDFTTVPGGIVATNSAPFTLK